MSKRNLTLLIIFLVIIVIGIFVFFAFYKPSSEPKAQMEGVNFLSNLLPFAKSKKTEIKTTEPADISGFIPETSIEIPIQQTLTKISTMPIAGFGVFMKERFVEMPVITPENTTLPNLPLSGEENSLISSGQNTSSPDNGDLGGSKTTIKTKVVKPTPPATEFVPVIRYVDKTNGNIYQTFADKIEERQFTTTIIPKVHEAYFGNNGGSVIMRYLNEDGKTIETFIGTLPKEILGGDTVIDNEIKGSFLPENISNINISPDTMKLFYLFNLGNNESSVGIVANSLSGDKKIQIFSSPFTEWLSLWPNKRMITITTKPSANVPGYMYAIDPDKKNLNKVLGNINGLTTLTSPDGKSVLYSNNNLLLSVYNINTRESNSIGLETLPEKCVWGKLSEVVYCAVPKYVENLGYPDIWYQGQVSFSDDIWKIDVANGTTTLISDLAKEDGIDGIKLSLDENENYLFFVNKKDSYLWELILK